MAEIIKTFREEVPAMRFIGKKYPDFGGWWGEWFANGWFDEIEHAMGGVDSILAIWENGGGYVGLEHRMDGNMSEYWIGMFTPADTHVPDGFAYIDFPAMGFGTCWICGTENEVHNTAGSRTEIEAHGMKIWTDADGFTWSFENCLCPRYTSPDENGNVILDYCFYVE